ncbi:hypothetical protein FRC07_004159 [Ceratobasidium sp. 392]|nr:hypothetical protein FRC07_004159 [Ceratobasidium sp. 392]
MPVGPIITSYSISDRVSDLDLTAAAITAQTEQRISWLLDEFLIRDQFHETPFELTAYACALEKEKDTRLLTLVLDLAFQKAENNQNAALNCPRLFEIMASETLPELEDGLTTNRSGYPLKGVNLFLKYLNDRLHRCLEDAWQKKESAVELFARAPDNLQAETAASKAARHWTNMISLANLMRRQYLTSELQLHEIIKKQFSASRLTTQEVSMLALLIMPSGLDAKSYKMKDRLEEHHSQLRILARREDLSQEVHRTLMEMVQALGDPDSKVQSQPSAKPVQSIGHSLANEEHPLATSPNTPLTASPKPTQPTSQIRSHSHTSGTMIAQAEPSFKPVLPQEVKFQVNSTTPLSEILEYFTQTSETPVEDYTTELKEAECSESAVTSSVLSGIWFATLRRGTRVAIKCVRTAISGSDKIIRHTVKELNVWSKLNHVNILPLLGVALFKGQLAMVSEWMDQGSIIKVVNSRPELDRFRLCAQVVEVVVWLHSKELVHGDLKGENILMTKDDIPKLTDFGLTIMHQEVLRFSRETTYRGGGTLRWMAPELFEDNPTRSYKTDVYALGMTMLEVLTGDVPFQEITNELQISSVVTRDKITPKRPECLIAKTPQHEAYWSAMRRCWVHNPKQRATAEEIGQIVTSIPEESGLAKSLKSRTNCCTMA